MFSWTRLQRVSDHRLKSTIGRLGWRFCNFRVKCAVYLVLCPSSLLSHHISRTDICRNTENTVVILRAGLALFGWMGHLYDRHFDDLLLLVLAKIRAQSKSDWLECVNQTMEAKKTPHPPMQCPLQTIGRHPEVRGEVLQDQLNLFSFFSTLSDDMTAHTARIRSAARQHAMQFHDNLSARRELD